MWVSNAKAFPPQNFFSCGAGGCSSVAAAAASTCLSLPEGKRHFIFLSFPKCYRPRPTDAKRSLHHRSLCTRTCHQFPSPPPLSYLSRSKSTPLSLRLAPRCAARLALVFSKTVSFLRRELFSFLGVTRDRVTAGGAGWGRLPRDHLGAVGGRIWC